MLKATVRVGGSGLHSLHGQANRGLVGHGLLLSVGKRPRCLRQRRVAVYTHGGLWETLLEVEGFLNEVALSDGSKPSHDGVFGHVAVPFQNVNEVPLVVGDGC